MSREFFRSFFLALGLHGGLLAVLCFSWPFISQSVFSFPSPEVFRVSIFDQVPAPGRPLPENRKKAPAESPAPTWSPPARKVSFSTTRRVTAAQEEEAAIQNENTGMKKEGPLEFNFSSGMETEVGQFKARADNGGGGGKDQARAAIEAAGSGQGNGSTSPMAIPRYEQNRPPYYPGEARERGWQGTALLNVLVLKDGTVGSLALFRSTGFPMLDRSALKAVKDWKFIPAKKNGQPVDMEVQVPVKFRLE